MNNDYGNITLNELKGKASINCDYGKILIGSLYHEDNSINMDYTSNSVIEFMNSGSVNADYSKLTIEKAKSIDLNADYTTTVIENIENLEFNCDYGKVEVSNGNNIVGNGDYLTMRFGKIYKKLEIEADYGGIKVEKLMSGFKNVEISSDYTGVKMGIESSAVFDFEIELSYGGFSFDDDQYTVQKQIDKNNNKFYQGFKNGQGSGSKIKIESDYGSVKFYSE